MNARVAYDPEIEPVVAAIGHMFAAPPDGGIPGRGHALPLTSPKDAVDGRAIEVEERLIPGPEGAPDLEVTIFRPTQMAAAVPGLYNMHGGGMVSGHRYLDNQRLVELVDQLGVVAVNVEYRLAPEHPFPAGVEDCYAGLIWMAANASALGVQRDRIAVMGGSAGGGLSAALSLMARDRQGPALAGQLLLCPMLDDRDDSVSNAQFDGIGTWQRSANIASWRCVLGDAVGTDDVSPYAAPSRATDLSRLPPAFIEAGAAEIFRDEDVDYASRIWAVGGDAELHIWSGACHGFDVFVPEARVSAAALDARSSWLRRVLGV